MSTGWSECIIIVKRGMCKSMDTSDYRRSVENLTKFCVCVCMHMPVLKINIADILPQRTNQQTNQRFIYIYVIYLGKTAIHDLNSFFFYLQIPKMYLNCIFLQVLSYIFVFMILIYHSSIIIGVYYSLQKVYMTITLSI